MTTIEPVLRVRLNGKTLRAKFPVPKSRWHGKYENVTEVVKAAWEAGSPQAMTIQYTLTED